MLQVFYIDVAKVDRNVAHVAMGYIRMFQVNLPTVCSFRWFIVTESTVRWFVVREKHCWMAADSADPAKRTGCKCFIYFRHMLQVFHLDVSKLDRDITYIYASVLDVFYTYIGVSSQCLQ
jgi:hypothetical protein